MSQVKKKIFEFRNFLEEIDISKINDGNFFDALFENIDNIQIAYEKETVEVPIQKIIEETGYSYSGISKMINNDPVLKNELLYAIDEQYCRLRDAFKIQEQILKNTENRLKNIVSCFIFFHKALINNKTLSEDKLTYSKANGENVLIHINGANEIKYTYYKRADLS